MTPVVFDTSTLILLAKVDMLRAVAQRVRVSIPLAVQEESTLKSEAMDAQYLRRLIEEGAIEVETRVAQEPCDRLRREFRLGHGEAACVAMAIERQWMIATDDGQALKACKVLGVASIPALAWLIQGAAEHWMTSAQAIAKLDLLKQYGWYAPGLVERVRRELEGGQR